MKQKDKYTARKVLRLKRQLEKGNFLTIHHSDIEELALEGYAVKHNKAPEIICKLFRQVNLPHYFLRI